MGCTDVALRKHSTDGTRLGCDIFYEQWENPLRAIICFATHRHSRAESTTVSKILSCRIHVCYCDVKCRTSSGLYRQYSYNGIFIQYSTVSQGRYPINLNFERKPNCYPISVVGLEGCLSVVDKTRNFGKSKEVTDELSPAAVLFLTLLLLFINHCVWEHAYTF